MPYVEVKAFESRFADEAVAERLIAAVTDAICDVFGEGVRDQTWVVVEGVPERHWGFGGKARG